MSKKADYGIIKAYAVMDKNCDTGYSFIVYAESRGKAIRYAMEHCDDAFDDYEYTEMRAIRIKALDGYKDKMTTLDWHNENDRIAMVRNAGFHCSYEMEDGDLECEECLASEWCERYKEIKEREK